MLKCSVVFIGLNKHFLTGKGIPIIHVLGKSKMIVGLLEGIPTMLKGEIAMVISSSFVSLMSDFECVYFGSLLYMLVYLAHCLLILIFLFSVQNETSSALW